MTEIKELLTFGQELGLQQLQTHGLVAIYGQRAVMPAGLPQLVGTEDDLTSITQHYARAGRDALKR